MRYIIASRGIQAAGRAGHAYVFSDAAEELIRGELAKMPTAKEDPHE